MNFKKIAWQAMFFVVGVSVFVSSNRMGAMASTQGTFLTSLKNYFSTSWNQLRLLFETAPQQHYIQPSFKTFSTQQPSQFSTVSPLQFSRTYETLKRVSELDIEKAYVTFGLKPGSSIKDVKKKYVKLVKEWHPDKNPNRLKEAEEMMKEINEAYDILRLAQEKLTKKDKKSHSEKSDRAEQPKKEKKTKSAKTKKTEKSFSAAKMQVELFLTMWLDDVKKAENLLKKGLDVNKPDETGDYLVHIAKSPEMIALLKKYGANFNTGTVRNPFWTPVKDAIFWGDRKRLEALKNAGADIVGWRSKDGENYLFYAITVAFVYTEEFNKRANVVAYLLSLGLDPFEKDKKGQTVYDETVLLLGKDVAELLFGKAPSKKE